MKNAYSTSGLLALSFCLLTSCFSNKYELVGKKKVAGARDLFVNIYQEDKFDKVTALALELVTEKDSIIIPRAYFTGTDETQEKIDRFYPCLRDSIFYLCYPYPQVEAMAPLNRYKSQLSHDSLFHLLKAQDPRLIDGSK